MALDDFDDGPDMSEEDLAVLNNMRPDLLRQWIIEKMLEARAFQHYVSSDTFIMVAEKIEQFIKEGKKDG